MTAALWKQSKVSPDGTYHIVNGQPLYSMRFYRVLSFHHPGLAAVCDEHTGWHIDVHGNPAYPYTFIKTFGFYENLAAVQSTNGWHHITLDGTAAYVQHYDWCGNFQNARAVVCTNNKYFHILPDGVALYKEYFAYAGDFKEYRAVVRLNSGWCAHISEDGTFSHPYYYRELRVYHKGYACAQDDNGWTHINAAGVPIYDRRFASLEPFYNERALAKTFAGEIVTIDVNGRNVGKVADSPQPAVGSPVFK